SAAFRASSTFRRADSRPPLAEFGERETNLGPEDSVSASGQPGIASEGVDTGVCRRLLLRINPSVISEREFVSSAKSALGTNTLFDRTVRSRISAANKLAFLNTRYLRATFSNSRTLPGQWYSSRT